MSDLEIYGGHYGIDPLRNYFEAALLPKKQDPLVAVRCPEVLTMATGVCVLGANRTAYEEHFDIATLDLSVDALYRSSSGADGMLLLNTHIVTSRAQDGAHAMKPNGMEVSLLARPLRGREFRQMFRLWSDGLVCGSPPESYAARQADLNFFIGVVDRIREAQFGRRISVGAQQESYGSVAANAPQRGRTIVNITPL